MDEYTEEFLRLQTRCENCENEAQQVAHYQRGLNHEIHYMMGVAAIFTLPDAIEIGKRAEKRVEWQPQHQSNWNFNYINYGLIGNQQYRGNYTSSLLGL